MLRLGSYAIIVAYCGSVRLLETGSDILYKMFLDQYEDNNVTRQLRNHVEIFIWKISKIDSYHITDLKIFILCQQSYEISEDQPNPTIAKPQGFSFPEFVGFESLVQGNSPKILAGCMIVQNDMRILAK